MGGCSVIVLMMLLWPFMLIFGAAALVASAAVEFVGSPAFPCLIASAICGILAAVDVARILWRRWKEGEGFPITGQLFVRPGVLAGLSFALFVVMCVISASMLLAFFRSLG